MKRQIVMTNTRHTSFVFRPLINFFVFLILFSVCSVGIAKNWATYRSDITRSGITSETIGPDLFLQWKYIPAHKPKPAWPMPAEELPRMHNDNAYHVVIADGSAYFGSCATNKIYSIDVAKGENVTPYYPSQRHLFEITEDGKSEFEDAGKHRKMTALLTKKQFERFLEDVRIEPEDVETMGSLTLEFGWLPAISFNGNNGYPELIWQNAYVTPLSRYGKQDERDWNRIRNAVIAKYC